MSKNSNQQNAGQSRPDSAGSELRKFKCFVSYNDGSSSVGPIYARTKGEAASLLTPRTPDGVTTVQEIPRSQACLVSDDWCEVMNGTGSPVPAAPRVVVTLQGGVVAGVLADVDIDLVTLDYDTEGVDVAELTPIPQPGAVSTYYEDAVVGVPPVEVDVARLEEILGAVNRHEARDTSGRSSGRMSAREFCLFVVRARIAAERAWELTREDARPALVDVADCAEVMADAMNPERDLASDHAALIELHNWAASRALREDSLARARAAEDLRARQEGGN